MGDFKSLNLRNWILAQLNEVKQKKKKKFEQLSGVDKPQPQHNYIWILITAMKLYGP